nr:hypothetical protein [uncultured Treponema sp.]
MDSKINISFDVEDIFGDKFLLNETLLDILQFCDSQQIPTDIYITAMRFSSINENEKLLDLLHNSNYINVGYHSNTHSFKTIPEQNSFSKLKNIEEYDFDISTKSFNKNKGGIKTLSSEVNPIAFRCPGFCWTPDYFDLMSEYKINHTTIDIKYDKVFKYKNTIVLPVYNKAIEKIESENDLITAIGQKEFLSFYLHPARLVYNHFWDKLKENTYHILASREIYDDYKFRIEKIKELFLALKRDFSLFSISKLLFKPEITSESEKQILQEKLLESMIDKWGWSQILTPIDEDYHINKLKHAFDSIQIGKSIITGA